jgi:hypothetical protein
MVLLVLPPTDHLWIGRNRGNSRVISAMQIDDQRVREDAAGMLAPGPELRIPGTAAQTRMVSMAGVRPAILGICASFQSDILRRHF